MEDQEFARLSKAVAQANAMCDIDPMHEVFKKDYQDAIAEYQKAKGKFYGATTRRILTLHCTNNIIFPLPDAASGQEGGT